MLSALRMKAGESVEAIVQMAASLEAKPLATLSASATRLRRADRPDGEMRFFDNLQNILEFLKEFLKK
jgi:hypothetical protein